MAELKQKSTAVSDNRSFKGGEQPLRLHKYLAQCGYGSRRQCEDLIRAGRVRVNGTVVEKMGVKIIPGQDSIEIDGQVLQPCREPLAYYILNKPPGYLTTCQDERGRRTVYDLLTGVAERVFPVGRLDCDSEGLLLFTNDGELAHRLMHPSFRVEKEYRVWVEGFIKDEAIRLLERGVNYEGEFYQPAQVQVVSRNSTFSELIVVIREGKKRQVRRMCLAVGHPVRRLIRVREGCLTLGKLKAGELRKLSPAEVARLRKEVGLDTLP
ncbi:MAG: rRNA pseudouridine synthase [Candidatus Sumerlaeaceae bacterium]|nr:rRNA pseudouridine synthase [Candidatus Sumerlaeaceae bacterium]